MATLKAVYRFDEIIALYISVGQETLSQMSPDSKTPYCDINYQLHR